MTDVSEHIFALPFGLPGDRDARLVHYLRDEDWASAVTLLRDVVNEQTAQPRWLLVLAYARFRDASDVMVDELGDASREALALIDRSLSLGAPLDDVAPLRDAVERALDDVSREELRLLAKLPEGDDVSALSDEDLESLAFLLSHHGATAAQKTRAAKLFDALGARRTDATALIFRARAALCLAEAGRFDDARAGLEHALAADWSSPPLSRERLLIEAVETQLLEHASGGEFNAVWNVAERNGAKLRFPFPSAWPHQERLLARCMALNDGPRARFVAQCIEDGREELSAALAERVRVARLQRA